MWQLSQLFELYQLSRGARRFRPVRSVDTRRSWSMNAGAITQLEQRLLLVVDPNVTFNGGVISIVAPGGGGGYEITVHELGGILVNGQAVIGSGDGKAATTSNTSQIMMTGSGSHDFLGVELTVPIPVIAALGGGDDTFYTKGSHSWTITNSSVSGGSDNYTVTGCEHMWIVGGDGDDVLDASTFTGTVDLYGKGGNDTLKAGSGDANLYGDDGNNLLIGQNGNDYLYCLEGRDTLTGGGGNDRIVSGNGGGEIHGDGGNDSIDASGTGNFLIYGDDGADTIAGGVGNDTIYGGEGNDILQGNSGNNLIYGDGGKDLLNSASGSDTLYGGDGNDILDAGGGNDSVFGGDGDDSITDTDSDDDSFDPGLGAFDNLFYAVPGSLSYDLSETELKSSDGAAVHTETLLSLFDQVFLQGNSNGNTFIVRGLNRQVSINPGPSGSGKDRLLVYSDAKEIRPSGFLSSYNITLTPFNGLSGVINWDGRGIDSLEIHGGDSSNLVTLDQWNSPLDALDGGGGDDTLSIGRDSNMTLKDGQLDIATPAAAIKFQNFEQVSLRGGVGNNRLDASAFHGRVSLFGDAGNDILIGTPNADSLSDNVGNDTLIGNGGNDTLWGGDGNDSLDGGDGTDQVFEVLPTTGSTGFVLTNTTLSGRGSDKLLSIEGAELRGRGGDETFNIGAWTGRGTNSLFGNGGNDTVVASANVNFTINGTDSGSAYESELTLKGSSSILWGMVSIEAANLTGGKSANRLTVLQPDRNGFFSQGIVFNGGSGTDLLEYRTPTDLVPETSSFTLSNTVASVAVNGRTPLRITLNSTVEQASLRGAFEYHVSDWTKAASIDGSNLFEEGNDPSRGAIESNFATSVTITSTKLTRADKASFVFSNLDSSLGITLSHRSGTSFQYNYNIDGEMPTVAINGAGGTDNIVATLVSGDTHALKVETLVETVVYAKSSQIGGKEIESVKLIGSSTNDRFEFDGLLPQTQYSIDGRSGDDTIAFRHQGEAESKFTDTELSFVIAGDTRRVALAPATIENIVMDASSQVVKVDVSGWKKVATINSGNRVMITSAADTNQTLTDSSLTRSDGCRVLFVNGSPQRAELSGGRGNNLIDASQFTGDILLSGAAGNDTLLGGGGGSLLYGGDGNDSLDGGTGVRLKILDGGAGTDKWRNGQQLNCEIIWV